MTSTQKRIIRACPPAGQPNRRSRVGVRAVIDAPRRERLWSPQMLHGMRVFALAAALIVGACATEPKPEPAPPAPVPEPVAAKPPVDEKARAEEAKAMLAQAETDVQRARSKRALWLKAWEELIAARRAVERNDPPAAIEHSRRASELAQLGLEQLAYPAVK